MDRNIARSLLLKLAELKSGQSILIDDLAKEFPDLSFDEFLKMVISLSTRNYVRIDGKYGFECYNLEKYNKIVGLDREGYEAVDVIRNKKIWDKVEKCLNENGYSDFSIFSAISLAKKIVEKELDKLIGD